MKKIDEKLYDYLQTLAHWAVVNGERVPVVLKSDVKKKYIGDRILGKSVRTVNRHFERLEEFGYLINGGKSMVYILPKATNLTEVLPTKTAQFLADTLKEDVIKIYKYLLKEFINKYNLKKIYAFGNFLNNIDDNRIYIFSNHKNYIAKKVLDINKLEI